MSTPPSAQAAQDHYKGTPLWKDGPKTKRPPSYNQHQSNQAQPPPPSSTPPQQLGVTPPPQQQQPMMAGFAPVQATGGTPPLSSIPTQQPAVAGIGLMQAGPGGVTAPLVPLHSTSSSQSGGGVDHMSSSSTSQSSAQMMPVTQAQQQQQAALALQQQQLAANTQQLQQLSAALPSGNLANPMMMGIGGGVLGGGGAALGGGPALGGPALGGSLGSLGGSLGQVPGGLAVGAATTSPTHSVGAASSGSLSPGQAAMVQPGGVLGQPGQQQYTVVALPGGSPGAQQISPGANPQLVPVAAMPGQPLLPGQPQPVAVQQLQQQPALAPGQAVGAAGGQQMVLVQQIPQQQQQQVQVQPGQQPVYTTIPQGFVQQ